MATATKKAHVAGGVSDPATLAFRTYRDNGERYHCEIVDGGGQVLAQSGGSFASQDDAERAARSVHERARVAPFEPQVAKERHTVVT